MASLPEKPAVPPVSNAPPATDENTDARPAGPVPEASAGADASNADREHRTGTVVSSTGSWYEGQTAGGLVSSKARGKLRLREEDTTNPIAVGDRVTLRIAPEDGTGYITAIHDRSNALTRRAAGSRAGQRHVIVANVDAAWAVQAVRRPKLNPGFLDRFLVMAGVCKIPAGIIFNKTDLARPEDKERVATLRALYADLDYPVLMTSATEGDGVEAVKDALEGRLSVLSGPSGAGKSTLLNAVQPGLGLRTGAVSDKTNKGRHTTTHAALYPLESLDGGGFVADTPGIREFGILDLEPDELGHFFVEFFHYLDDCKFPDCTHDHEPGCAVKDAVQDGAIHEQRYESYLNILASLREGEARVGW
ncbi:MAG: ribosome small subunit-dependent GTPase A [Bacteroidetes bacterium QS_9_68_14]|nr:MAG: ribosome small subunit-dependent GTPase A [Bacteroidetes bacterium QS_9_68_14]